MTGNVAAIDIGTNSVRLLVTDPRGAPVAREMHITRLGQGVDIRGTLAPEAITRTLAVLADYARKIERHAVAKLRAAATSAVRDASNRDAFLEPAARCLRQPVELLSGEAEATLTFRGATADLPRERAPFLVIDIGAGSTEFVLGTQAPEALISVDMGCVRMTERHLLSDPPSAQQLQACLDDIRGRLEEVQRTIPVRQARCVIGLAGTVTALACLQLGSRRYDPTLTHGLRLTREQVECLFDRLARADVNARRRMLAEPKRAEVIVGGCTLLVAILRALDIEALRVSESDILDGLAQSLRAVHG